MEAIISVYIDSERTDYYGKFTYRYFASMIMEFVWSDAKYREKFVYISKAKPDIFIEFCNFLISDVNNLLFEGLICLSEIKNYEEI